MRQLDDDERADDSRSELVDTFATSYTVRRDVFGQPSMFSSESVPVGLDLRWDAAGPCIMDNCVRQNVSECVSCIRVRFCDIDLILDTTLQRNSTI